MNYLSDYTSAKQTQLLNDNGAFFAFSQKQLDEEKKEGVVYMSIAPGLIVPKINASKILKGFEAINTDGVKQDISENGIKAIIHRELANYEAQITGDISDTVQALEDYGITREQVSTEYPAYFQYCIDNDYF
jgi:hypothetical protein|tara:strand:- start:159 stop:554 length:396 start_codon:yes stop_codon:yes gene_type:complete